MAKNGISLLKNLSNKKRGLELVFLFKPIFFSAKKNFSNSQLDESILDQDIINMILIPLGKCQNSYLISIIEISKFFFLGRIKKEVSNFFFFSAEVQTSFFIPVRKKKRFEILYFHDRHEIGVLIVPLGYQYHIFDTLTETMSFQLGRKKIFFLGPKKKQV